MANNLLNILLTYIYFPKNHPLSEFQYCIKRNKRNSVARLLEVAITDLFFKLKPIQEAVMDYTTAISVL